ncbi:hypothetical protein F2P56_012067 [Juglans regia]|uniref:Wall-associated receptor kinase 2-like n=1 Tax=Juglans regia TaxID=51240 RepID=A0A834CWK4_JUGRE|nr:hypothetical protein F2P56_012067 [Juglans regia]
MDLHGKLLQQLLLGVLILAAIAASIPNSICERMCGKVEIPYPFGTSEGCYLDKPFLITCNHTFSPPKPFLDVDLPVVDISVPNGELRVSNRVAHICKRGLHSEQNTDALLNLSSFRISRTRNKITAVGCDVYTSINVSDQGQKGFTTGCLSLCDQNLNVVNESCSGIGCCQTSIPKGTTRYILHVRSLYNDTLPGGKHQCGYGFIVDEQAYKFSSLDFANLKNRKTVPLVLDWAIGNKTCKDAQKNKGSYACKATHSYCYDSTNSPGYRCNCSKGYRGNPYLPDGQDDSCQGK